MQQSQQLSSQLSRAYLWAMVIGVGLIAPAVVLVIVEFIGKSLLVEELTKALVVGVFIINASVRSSQKLLAATTFGLLFGVSETVMYLGNFIYAGEEQMLLSRLLWTVPMHGLTAYIIAAVPVLTDRTYLLVLGVMVGLMIHVGFNNVLVPLVM